MEYHQHHYDFTAAYARIAVSPRKKVKDALYVGQLTTFVCINCKSLFATPFHSGQSGLFKKVGGPYFSSSMISSLCFSCALRTLLILREARIRPSEMAEGFKDVCFMKLAVKTYILASRVPRA